MREPGANSAAGVGSPVLTAGSSSPPQPASASAALASEIASDRFQHMICGHAGAGVVEVDAVGLADDRLLAAIGIAAR